MRSEEALKELFELAVFDDNCNLNKCNQCSSALKKNCCAYQYCETVKQDLEVLEAFKNFLVVGFTPPVFEVDPNKEYNVSDCLNYFVKYNNYILDKEIREKLTQWIIYNIDKKTVMEWLSMK